MSEFAFQDVLDATGAVLVRGGSQVRMRGVSTDTRSLQGGELFVSLSGPNFDGNQFAVSAAESGAAGLLLRRETGVALELERIPAGTAVALHDSPGQALADLAAWHRARLEIPVIGITGSCGKTTTKNILLDLLQDRAGIVGSPASFNNAIGVPHTLLLADARTEVLIVEMGTNHPGEIASLCRTAQPTGGIITNVGASHLEGLGSIEGVAREKGELAASLPQSGFCVLNGDCRWTPKLRELTDARILTFSVDGTGDLNATDVWFHPGGTTFRLNGEHEITSPLLGLHTVQNLLAALAACVGLGIEPEEVLPAVSRLRAGRRRMERIEIGGLTLFDDSYNANPESARASVRVLAGLHGHARRVLVLGDMLELGDYAAELHHEIGVLAAEAGVDSLLLLGELTQATAAGAVEGGLPLERVLHFPEVEGGLDVIPGLLRDGDVVLVKGSRSTGLDRLVNRLLELEPSVS